MTRTIAIIGFTNAKHYAPWNDRTIEFWGFNDPGRDLWNATTYPFTRWYQLHQRTYLERGQPTPEHLAYFAANTLPKFREMRSVPLYVWDADEWKDCPTARTFPREAVEALSSRGRYHLSSVDWMVAHAILEKPDAIHVYGIGFSPTEGGEPLGARACLEYWLGYAEGLGIKTHVTGGAMFKTYQFLQSDRQYGVDQFFNEVNDKGEYRG